MYRTCMSFLKDWLVLPRRMPLVIRGARQVGKTWIVRNLAESTGRQLVEINFEMSPELAALFEPNDPHAIVRRIEEVLGLSIDPANTILFLDEIQAKPELFAKLRWFYELMPELPVIAAGSLLEFVLSTHLVSMPVGRISFMYLEPMSFIEFLQALKKNKLIERIQSYTWESELSPVVHNEIMRLFKQYVFIGGLPAAVFNWVEDHSLAGVKFVHRALIGTYRTDFNKYGGRTLASTLNDVVTEIPVFLGRKFVYSQVNSTSTQIKVKEALNQLVLARIAYKVQCTSANGIPLSSEVNHKYIKIIFLDVGLCSEVLKLSLRTLEDIEELDVINKGGIAEQVTGQLLRASAPCDDDPALYYWIRAERGSDAEVDYVIQHGRSVVPIEVKAGTTGTLKSLHMFMRQKKLSVAVRVYSGLPAITEVNVKDNQSNEISYQLRSIPFYLISELQRLLD